MLTEDRKREQNTQINGIIEETVLTPSRRTQPPPQWRAVPSNHDKVPEALERGSGHGRSEDHHKPWQWQRLLEQWRARKQN